MMRCRYLPLALLIGAGLALVGSLPAPAGESADKEKIDKLIEKMGSSTFAERQKATKELAAIGAPALEALRKAAKREDPELRKRAGELVKKLDKEATSAKLLAPKRVHLVYKDTPVPEAVADFQKKSGYNIHLLDPEGKLKERTITLDTGETTFWRAYGLFCAKAGLTEATAQDAIQVPVPVPAQVQPGAKLVPQRIKPIKGAPPVPAPAVPPVEKKPVEKKPGRAAQAADTPAAAPPVKPLPPQPAPAVAPAVVRPGARIAVPFTPGVSGQLMLKDGKAKKLPTDDGSAVRVRALPKADMLGNVPEGEILLALEATPEPKLQWQSFQSIRIDKALDDQDQKLSQVMPQVPAGPPGIGAPGAPVPLPAAAKPAIARPMIAVWGGVNQAIPVQLKKGEKAAKTLKELQGTITAQMLSEAKPMIVADNLAKAAGKTFKGDEGGTIKIIEVKSEGKTTTIRLELEQPADTVPAMPPMGVPGIGAPIRLPRQGAKILPAPAVQPALPVAPAAPPAARAPAAPPQVAQVQVRIQAGGGGVVIGNAAFAGGLNGLSVQDDKGKTLPVRMGQQQFRVVQGPGGANAFLMATYTLVCEPGKDQGKPAKVVYLGRKRVTVDIPFALKDVPLP